MKGHLGSAVFNEANQLVGMNFFYTRSKGVDYCVDSKKHQQEQKENQQDQKEKSSPGGLVSAIDLHTIRHTLQLFLPKATGKVESLNFKQACVSIFYFAYVLFCMLFLVTRISKKPCSIYKMSLNCLRPVDFQPLLEGKHSI